ncbi:MAG: hypothetical protein VX014_06010, partial [Verrucomicrobiota bacterium]|nr:hypothetical protein [Verrucomicrobiota bacterium]
GSPFSGSGSRLSLPPAATTSEAPWTTSATWKLIPVQVRSPFPPPCIPMMFPHISISVMWGLRDHNAGRQDWDDRSKA